jgi:hypothetical protein
MKGLTSVKPDVEFSCIKRGVDLFASHRSSSQLWRSTLERVFTTIIVLAFVTLAELSLAAESIPVLRTQGTFHGFLVLKTLEGKRLATGDLVQVGDGDRVTSRLTLRFRDGSLDDETTVFSQQKVFHLITDHHIQRGPSFPKSLDITVDAAKGLVTFHDEKGKAVENHIDLPPDVSNGLPLVLLLNLDPKGPPQRFPMVLPTLKPRLVHIVVSPEGADLLLIGASHRQATNFRIKVDLGAVTGTVASVMGKKPEDVHVWILPGEAPAFVREQGQFYERGPVWRLDLIAPVFPKSP